MNRLRSFSINIRLPFRCIYTFFMAIICRWGLFNPIFVVYRSRVSVCYQIIHLNTIQSRQGKIYTFQNVFIIYLYILSLLICVQTVLFTHPPSPAGAGFCFRRCSARVVFSFSGHPQIDFRFFVSDYYSLSRLRSKIKMLTYVLVYSITK